MSTPREAYIVTHHWVPNFGANLQALATLEALRSRGIAARFVDFRPPELEEKYTQAVPRSQFRAHDAFVKEHLPLTEPVSGQAAFEALCERAPTDIYITGSDAVFRVDPNSDRSDLVFPNPYWLCGAKGRDSKSLLKFALAPSAMGTLFATMPLPVRMAMKEALEDMSAVSARDKWTQDQIASLGYRGSVAMVPDPVFALGKRIREARSASVSSRPYIVVSTQHTRSTRWVEQFTRIASAAGFDTLALPTPEGVLDGGAASIRPLPIDPLEWLHILAGSSGYVGVRFHPVVVSLIAGVPIVALDLYHGHPLKRKRSKTWLLLREFGLDWACHARRMHRFISPAGAWRQLERQIGMNPTQQEIAGRFSAAFDDYLTLALNGGR